VRPRFLLSFLGWAAGLSGGDRHLLEMAARWRSHVDITVLAPPEAAPTVRSFLDDVEFSPLGRAGPKEARRGAALAFEYVRRAARASRTLPRADVAVAASHFAADGAALRTASRGGALGVAYVYHLISTRTQRDARTLWSLNDERAGLALIRRHAGLVFTSNAETASALRSRGITPVHTDVGVDIAAFHPGDPATRPPQAVFVARMVKTKGVVDAVEAWARVVRELPHARLVLVGSGPELEAAKARAAGLGIGASLEWRGFVSEEDKRAELVAARFLLAPSYEEGWGISICEGLASGLPVVAYRLPTLDELFGDAYVPVPAGDVDALARTAVELLTDDRRVAELAVQSRKTAERYDLDRVAESELEEILRRRAA
jgi:glycosyltransferase involved in cell wall biosynthesis